MHAALQLTLCPDPACARPAEITTRFVLESTDGPVEHARVHCVARHMFTLPTAFLAPEHEWTAPRPRAILTTEAGVDEPGPGRW